ncbi:exodeoxyribonuclease VII large subunit [candidate division WWE3 bacterium]|nr:exodeoxyribonuclease VII large subunit [candidate division WWE3 bacterium]
MPDMVLKVSEFNELIHTYLSQSKVFTIAGEISQLKISQNKWVFMTIKDESASLDVFGTIFQITNYKLLEEGMQVHVYGIPGLYVKTGRFSLQASQVIPSGDGSLKIAYEKLKLQLEKEGLFDRARKRTLPEYPERIGLITAKGSQAYNDFVKVLAERWGGIKIYFLPVQVQGNAAVKSVCQAIEYMNGAHPDIDVLVVTRGGGSLEDLIAFNDENVVRSIFASRIPVVSAIGHEGDVSLSDMVADLRASTPSNAAQLIVKDRAELKKLIIHRQQMLGKLMDQKVLTLRHRVKHGVEKMSGQMQMQTNRFHKQLHLFNHHLLRFEQRRQEFRTRIYTNVVRLNKSIDIWLERHMVQIQNQTKLLKSLDYQRILQRGFSITRRNDGTIIRSIQDLPEGATLITTISDGVVYSSVDEIKINHE